MNANATKLKSVILAAKGYNKATKARVLAQIPETVNDEQLKQALCNIETCLKANRELLKRYDAIKKQAVYLEVHQYAPELNKLHFLHGGWTPAHGCTTMHDAIMHAAKGVQIN